MPNVWDYALVLVFAVIWPLYTFFVEWPRHKRRVAAGEPDARVHMYRGVLIQQWAIMAAIVALTIAFHRSFADALWLRVPAGWRLPLGFGFPLVYGVLLALQVPALARKPASLSRLRGKLEKDLGPLIPTRPVEWSWFRPLAVTAGICEELMFRGYLIWVLTPALGLWGAALVSVVIFGLGHSYQGLKFAPRAFGAGVAMQALALLTGSVLPGIVLHAMIDLGSGYVTYLAMQVPPPAEAPVAA
jgi:membrane protease YdiL (CAAX protease family)